MRGGGLMDRALVKNGDGTQVYAVGFFFLYVLDNLLAI